MENSLPLNGSKIVEAGELGRVLGSAKASAGPRATRKGA